MYLHTEDVFRDTAYRRATVAPNFGSSGNVRCISATVTASAR